ncbi:MAG: selenocysteine synthase [Planctomycetaceae bacterium]|jgi:L-seryl-tRNA(Ser) seleniumtransferase|nr:selenocysteine synthase [Planctomycetaceae bacterium]
MTSYQDLGLTPIINASGAVTRLGGAPMPPEVLDAFRDGAQAWVPLEQLQAAAGRRIAELTGTDAGLVTAGSAAALTLGTAAILCGYDLGRIERLPHCEGFPHEFIIAREQRSGYDHAVRAAGARFVEVGFNEIVSNAGVRRTEAWEFEAAFTENTAGVFYGFGRDSQPPLAEVIERAHRHGLPVLVDAAGELPPKRNLSEIAALGADLVAFSGGKAIRGPQSTGILCGRKDLVASAALQMLDMDDHLQLWNPPADLVDSSKLDGLPRHGIGRPLKVSKEEVLALMTALELFASGGYDADWDRQHTLLASIATQLADQPVTCTIEGTREAERSPLLSIEIDEAGVGRSAFDICRGLRDGSPAVYVSHGRLAAATLTINPLCLDDTQAPELARRIREELAG